MVPTQIILVIAPINAILNYFLGIKVSPLHVLITTDLWHLSLGSRTRRSWLRWSAPSNCDIFQLDFYCVDSIRDLLCPWYCLAPLLAS